MKRQPMSPRPVRFYFDFLSPYSYLASQLLAREARYQSLVLDPRPVVFGTILARLGVKGPGEIPARRRHGLQDVLLLASAYDLPLVGPPTHPFNSIYALRSVVAFDDPQVRLRLSARYFRAAWGEGQSLEDLSVLRACLSELGLDQDPEEAATTKEHRQQLKQNTEALLEAGGFGVPTFAIDGLLFFGHDRLPLLLDYLERGLDPRPDHLAALLARPQPGRLT
ncbi:MAG: 2-hydroxychromene-2-carboxylate isomerase [Deltaproteobacteria bacterium]|nr:2-hydroxychromene-2-carboxylate isomerase [Deltaproteobacteria bacterium]